MNPARGGASKTLLPGEIGVHKGIPGASPPKSRILALQYRLQTVYWSTPLGWRPTVGSYDSTPGHSEEPNSILSSDYRHGSPSDDEHGQKADDVIKYAKIQVHRNDGKRASPTACIHDSVTLRHLSQSLQT